MSGRTAAGSAGRGIGAVQRVAAIAATMVLLGLPSADPATAHTDSSPQDAARVADETPLGGSVGIRLVDIPVATADDPRTHEYIVDHVEPGEIITRRVEISNTTAADLDVTVYAGPASIENDAFRGAEGRGQSELTSWMTVGETDLTVPPGGAVMDSVSITVPADAAPGEQYGIIWAEVHGSDDGAVALVARTGIRIYLSVGGDNPPPSSFTITGLTAERDAAGAAVVTGTVTNTGGRALDLAGTVNLVAVDGMLAAGPYPVDVGTTLAPGDTGRVRALITDDIANGPWATTLELHSGLVTQTATVELEFPTEPGGTDEVLVGNNPLPLIIAAALAGAALVAVIVWFALRRHRRASAAIAKPAPQAPVVG